VRTDNTWVGSASEFPDGMVAHAGPPDRPGFFLVRATSGAFRAYADRSPHHGEPLEFRNPLPGTTSHADGPQPGFYDPAAGAAYTLDGEAFAGPGPRPLDPFALRTDGDRLEIAMHAVCPDEAEPPAWCGPAADGPHALEPGRAVVLVSEVNALQVFAEPGLRAGQAPVRHLSGEELRALGFVVVHSLDDLDLLVDAGARVVWFDRAELDQVPSSWVRAQYAAGLAIGVLDGTPADLANHFGIGDTHLGWIRPGSGRPAFALVQAHQQGGRQTSDWLNTGWLIAASSA
jgi:hypothetical protein